MFKGGGGEGAGLGLEGGIPVWPLCIHPWCSHSINSLRWSNGRGHDFQEGPFIILLLDQ